MIVKLTYIGCHKIVAILALRSTLNVKLIEATASVENPNGILLDNVDAIAILHDYFGRTASRITPYDWIVEAHASHPSNDFRGR